ncbi:MAG: hypothetical protein ACOCWR_01095 [Oceanidesulfovibrio sp.]
MRSDVPILFESEIEHGRLVAPGVYVCESCEDVLAVGWDAEAMLHTFQGSAIHSVRVGERRLVEIASEDGYALLWGCGERR